MGGPHGPEVALVERRDLRLAQTLGKGHDACIDNTEREIRVAGLELAAAGEIRARRWLHAVDAREQVVEKDEPGLGRQPPAAPIAW